MIYEYLLNPVGHMSDEHVKTSSHSLVLGIVLQEKGDLKSGQKIPQHSS